MKGAIALAFVIWLAPPMNLLAEETRREKADEEQPIPPAPPEAGTNDSTGALFQISGIGMFAASGLDMATTEWGLRQPGISEGNPVVSNRGARVALHVVAPAAVWWTTDRLRKNGHGKWAVAIRIGLLVAYSYAAVHNLNTVQGH